MLMQRLVLMVLVCFFALSTCFFPFALCSFALLLVCGQPFPLILPAAD